MNTFRKYEDSEVIEEITEKIELFIKNMFFFLFFFFLTKKCSQNDETWKHICRHHLAHFDCSSNEENKKECNKIQQLIKKLLTLSPETRLTTEDAIKMISIN